MQSTKKEIKTKTKEEIKQESEKRKEDTKIINELVMNWQNTFGNLKNWNQERNGYTLNNIEVTDYGLKARIYAPWGLDIFDLEKYTSVIESGCKCEFIYEIPQHRQFAMAKFVYPLQVKVNEILFEPIKLKPYQFCPGLDLTGEPIIFDVNSASHILIAGQTRRGKNISCYISIVSWIHYCKPNEVLLYLFQGAKNDLSQFQNCEHTYCYTNKLEEMVIALRHIKNELTRREELFAPMVSKAEGNDNIYFYNKLHPTNKLPYIYIIIDEFIAIMPDNTVDSKEIKEQKNEILNLLQAIVQYGGSQGLQLICIHQKPEKLLLPAFLKNMCNIRICFGFEDETCVQIVLGSGLIKKAHKLPPRKAYYSNNEQNGYLYTPNMKGRIKMFIKDSIKPNHRTLFDDLKKLNSNKLQNIEVKDVPVEQMEEQIATQSTIGTVPLPIKKKESIDLKQQNTKDIEIIKIPETKTNIEYAMPKGEAVFDKVDPIKINNDTETLKANISNIPDFVPFNPKSQPKVIIDQTKIDFSKTQKPKKKNKEES